MLTDFEEAAAAVVAAWDEERQLQVASSALLKASRDTRPPRRESIRSDYRDDVLDEVLPADYVEALTGVEVPRHGMIPCPLPGHDDHEPSFKVYDTPDRGWYCYGCGRGGSIYDLGAELWGMATRGAAFHDLRRELARVLLGGAA